MTPIDRAKADLARLQKELARAQIQITQLQSQIGRVEAYIEMAPVYETDEAHSDAARNRGIGVAATASRMCIDIIRERGQRLHSRDLLKILQDQNVLIGGVNPIANLSGFLSRTEELRNSRAEGWGLAEWGDGQSPAIAATPTAVPSNWRPRGNKSEEATSVSKASGQDFTDETPL